MDIDTAYYGKLTTKKQKERFYRIQKLSGIIWTTYKIIWTTYNKVNHYILVPFGKWYIHR